MELLRKNGYSLIVTEMEGGLPWWKARHFLPTSLLRSVDNMIVSHLPNLFGYQSLLVAQPKRTEIY